MRPRIVARGPWDSHVSTSMAWTECSRRVRLPVCVHEWRLYFRKSQRWKCLRFGDTIYTALSTECRKKKSRRSLNKQSCHRFRFPSKLHRQDKGEILRPKNAPDLVREAKVFLSKRDQRITPFQYNYESCKGWSVSRAIIQITQAKSARRDLPIRR